MAIWSLFPDWAPSLNLGYTKLSVISSPETACERNARRKRRNENKTLQDEKHKGNKKILHEIEMSSLFINLILRTPHYLHIKVLNERISKWAHLSFYHKWFSRYLHLKFEKEVIFLGRFSPYEIPESGDKISYFWVFKIAFK